MFQIGDTVSPSITGLSVYKRNDFGEGWGIVVSDSSDWGFEFEVKWEGGENYLCNTKDLVPTNPSLENE